MWKYSGEMIRFTNKIKMLKTLRFSLKKSKILAKIRKVVESRKFDAQSILENAMRNAVSGETMSKKELYIEELLTLLSKDRATIHLLGSYNLRFDFNSGATRSWTNCKRTLYSGFLNCIYRHIKCSMQLLEQ